MLLPVIRQILHRNCRTVSKKLASEALDPSNSLVNLVIKGDPAEV